MEKIKTHLKTGESHQLPAGTAVQAILRMLKFDPALYSVFEIWDRETRGLVRGCEATGIQGSRLVVQVPSAAHRQELLYSKDRIIARVNQALGRRVITDVIFEFSTQGRTTSEQTKTRTGFERYR